MSGIRESLRNLIDESPRNAEICKVRSVDTILSTVVCEPIHHPAFSDTEPTPEEFYTNVRYNPSPINGIAPVTPSLTSYVVVMRTNNNEAICVAFSDVADYTVRDTNGVRINLLERIAEGESATVDYIQKNYLGIAHESNLTPGQKFTGKGMEMRFVYDSYWFRTAENSTFLLEKDVHLKCGVDGKIKIAKSAKAVQNEQSTYVYSVDNIYKPNVSNLVIRTQRVFKYINNNMYGSAFFNNRFAVIADINDIIKEAAETFPEFKSVATIKGGFSGKEYQSMVDLLQIQIDVNKEAPSKRDKAAKASYEKFKDAILQLTGIKATSFLKSVYSTYILDIDQCVYFLDVIQDIIKIAGESVDSGKRKNKLSTSQVSRIENAFTKTDAAFKTVRDDNTKANINSEMAVRDAYKSSNDTLTLGGVLLETSDFIDGIHASLITDMTALQVAITGVGGSFTSSLLTNAFTTASQLADLKANINNLLE